MMQEDKISDNSDNQGFISGRIQIDSTDDDTKKQTKRSIIKKQYQPRYINGHGIIKKQPKQCFYISQEIQIKNYVIQQITKQIDTNRQDEYGTQNYYNNADKFVLLYNRNQSTFENKNRLAFQNQVSLRHFQHQTSHNYHKLRQFNPNTIKQISIYNDLMFDSTFQGGNLLYAYRCLMQNHTYCLFMQNDTNTYGYNQWFYFSVRNMKPNQTYKFKIVNFKKKYSFFEMGFKPAIFSLNKAKKDQNGWYRDGYGIKYSKSSLQEQFTYYSLQFYLQFPYQNDYVTISPYMPYSYSKLINFLSDAQQLARQRQLFYNMEPIGRSLASNDIPYISLTKNQQNLDKKPNIVIMARQHSGQTWSSFLVQEIIKQLLTQANQHNQYILNNYVVRIFPMINVDGVIYGNFRCDLAGYDLNRSWKNPIPIIHDHIVSIKNQLERFKKTSGIELCLDLHTHSRQLGAFAYCSSDSEQGRELPLIFSKISPIFRYKACTFGISEDKKSTARAYMYKISKKCNTLTIQLSAFGFKAIRNSIPIQYSPKYIKHLAYMICYGYFCYNNKSIKPVHQQLKILNELFSIQTLNKYSNEDENPVIGSDSQPDVDQIELNIKIQKIFPKKISQIIIESNKKYNLSNLNLIDTQFKKKTIDINIPSKRNVKTKSMMRNQIVSKIQSNNHFTIDTQQVSLHAKTTNFINAQIKSSFIQNNRKIKSYEKSGIIRSKNDTNPNRVVRLKSTLPLNSIQFSLGELPKPKQVQKSTEKIKFEDQYFPLVAVKSYSRSGQSYQSADKQNSAFNQAKTKTNKPKVRSYIKRHQLIREQQRLQQQLPYLLILSDKKKQKYYARFKQQRCQPLQPNKNEKQYFLNGTKFTRLNNDRSFYARKQSLIIFKDEQAKMKYEEQKIKSYKY